MRGPARATRRRMKTLYFDCFAGISGDMFVGALLDLGLEISVLRRELEALGLDGYRIDARRVDKRGLQAMQFSVLLQSDGAERLADLPPSNTPLHAGERMHDQSHRALSDILALIEHSGLSLRVKRDASRIFMRLGGAEASVHGIPIDTVQFHEVGGVDAIVDIVSAAIGLEQLGIERVLASPLHLGSGMVRMSHGLYPIPAPATAKLLEGVPVYATDSKGELTTPTGAAIVTTLAHAFGALPPVTVLRTGYGAGTKDREFPNVLRAIMCEQTDAASLRYQTGQATVIEANIDDMNPQHYEPLMTHLFGAGALDVTLLPLQMKKQRPGTLLQVIADRALVSALLDIIFRESSTIGVRTYEVTRYMLPRAIITVTTRYGDVRVKVACLGGDIVNAMPEYEDCRARAERAGVSIKAVTAAAQAAIDSNTNQMHAHGCGLNG